MSERTIYLKLGLDHDKDQYQLVNEALNLLFEHYGKPPIA
jgi:hypothetical protein